MTNVTPSTSENPLEDVLAYVIVESVIAFLAFCSNALVLIAICRFKNLHTNTFVLIGSLAVADIAVALLANPSGIVLRFNYVITPENYNGTVVSPSLHQGVCSLFICLVLILTQVSIWNLLIIAIDRFIAIYYPLRYKAIVTSFRLKICIAATWVGSVVAIVPHTRWYATHSHEVTSSDEELNHCAFEDQIILQYMVIFNFFSFMLFPLVIMLVLYYFIFRSAKAQLRKIYSDVLVLNKKSKTSLSSLKEMFHIQDQFGQEMPPKHKCLRKQIALMTRKFRRTTSKSTETEENQNSNHKIVNNKLRDGKDHEMKELFPQTKHSNESRIMAQISPALPRRETLEVDSLNLSRRSTLSRDSFESTEIQPQDDPIHLKPEQKYNRKCSNASSLRANTVLNCSVTDLRKKKLRRKSKRLNREFRAARSLCMVLGVFAICWLPLHIHNSIYYFHHDLSQPQGYVDFAILISHANSLINPAIYALQLKEMRVAFKKMFKQLCGYFNRIFCRRSSSSSRSETRARATAV